MRSSGAFRASSHALRMVMLWTSRFCGSCRRRAWCARGLFLAIVQVVAVCLAADVCAAEPPDSHDYIVGPNDVLPIRVVDQPRLTGKSIMRADGTFTFPMLGRLQAGGLSLQTVEDNVR